MIRKLYVTLCIAHLSSFAVIGCGTGPMGGGGNNDPAALPIPGPQGPAGADGKDGLDGANGTNGVDGADGIDGDKFTYGDGSAGTLVIQPGQTAILFNNVAADRNLQFVSLLVSANATLNVPSGTVIRCTTNFINAGTINVLPNSHSGGQGYISISGGGLLFDSPSAGISGDTPDAGNVGNLLATCFGGLGGDGLDTFVAGNIFKPGPLGGGGGAGGYNPPGSTPGGNGGGTLVVLAGSGLANLATGTIHASGAEGLGGGSGGGAGGIIILASKTSATNLGQINARGADGRTSSTQSGAGGGGGGGIVHLIAPSLTMGNIDVSGGAAGPLGGIGSVTNPTRAGGGGGGAGGGFGGTGGSVSTVGTPNSASAGTIGGTFSTTIDPTALF